MTQFGDLNRDGTLSNVREIPQSKLMECPHFMLVADHYREDGSCRCNDPDDPMMAKYGYTWKDGAWR